MVTARLKTFAVIKSSDLLQRRSVSDGNQSVLEIALEIAGSAGSSAAKKEQSFGARSGSAKILPHV